MSLRKLRIALIPGDGIGKEVIPAGARVLSALAAQLETFELEFTEFLWGSDWYRQHGKMLPDDALDTLKDGCDAILFGSAGDPEVPDHVTLWGLRLKIVQGLDMYANVRPSRLLRGIESPLKDASAIDWVIVRENTEGEYSGAGGRVHAGIPDLETATDVTIMTRRGCERVIRFAFQLAQSRPRKLLTVVTKSNAQRHAMVLWDEVAKDVSKEFPDVKMERELVDAMAARMVARPGSIDTVVASNLHADILTDLAAALVGSMGIAPTANLDPERRFPSLFEPIHGSAFDIMGKGLANPIGTFWSCVMMLDFLGEKEASKQLMDCIEEITDDPKLHTRDLGGEATTEQVTSAMIERIRSLSR